MYFDFDRSEIVEKCPPQQLLFTTDEEKKMNSNSNHQRCRWIKFRLFILTTLNVSFLRYWQNTVYMFALGLIYQSPACFLRNNQSSVCVWEPVEQSTNNFQNNNELTNHWKHQKNTRNTQKLILPINQKHHRFNSNTWNYHITI